MGSREGRKRRQKWTDHPEYRGWPECFAIEAAETRMGKRHDPTPDDGHDDNEEAVSERQWTPAPPIQEILEFGVLATTRRASPAPPIPRPASLPALHIKFTCTKSASQTARMFASGTKWMPRGEPRFQGEEELGTYYLQRAVWQKPSIEYMTQASAFDSP